LQQRLDPAAMGLVFQPVKSQGLAAAAGTTPFGVLFLGFSFFIIAAAVMLVALLFRLGIDSRAAQIGTLLAVGFSRRKVRHLLLGEGLLVAALGSLLGVPVGIGYAALMLLGLQTLWLDAIVTPFLHLHWTAASLAIGFVSGLAAAFAAIWLSARRIGRIPPRRLMAGQIQSAGTLRAPLLGSFLHIPWIGGRHTECACYFKGSLLRLAMRNAARNPGRSLLTIGLVAAASFLIVVLSAFYLDPSRQVPTLHSGNGGFALAAESDQPIFHNLNSPEGRKELGFSAEDEKLLAGCTIVSLRVRSGDDASCLNLYRPRQPRVLGIPRQFIDRDGFAWADKPRDAANPWTLLDDNPDIDSDGVPRVPVILEKNTANYSLQLWGGLGETFEISDAQRKPIRLVVVALLADSIFQGDLLVGESAFLRHFPEVNGFRFFLVETPPAESEEVQKTLDRELGDYGFASETTGQRLAAFLAVQNTYLSTFQSLGGLGLLLGTFGLAAVQLRNVLERRGELALLRAVGFRRAKLGWLVFLEHAVLLIAGLGIGATAAILLVLPQVLLRSSTLPWASLAGTLALVLAVGLAAGVLAVRAALKAPLLATLREERA
jgi:ABC-type antimicrobial peptide transport system permease subunit